MAHDGGPIAEEVEVGGAGAQSYISSGSAWRLLETLFQQNNLILIQLYILLGSSEQKSGSHITFSHHHNCTEFIHPACRHALGFCLRYRWIVYL